MCRICGLASLEISPRELRNSVEKMCDALRHGGPDDSGIYAVMDDTVVLGNRRLALLDLSAAGHQPMVYREKLSITYNGELYNFQKLKEELLVLGHSFSSKTDTEVILAAYAQWGTRSFSMLEGMFAFAIFDARSNDIFLVRDPAGIKPLYYSTSFNSLTFASEVRAFRETPFKWSEKKEWPALLMAYGFLPEPYTIYNEIRSLPKGCYLKYNVKERSEDLSSFRFFSFSSVITNRKEAAASIRQDIQKAVERQMVADAPVGVFFSGGLDSAIMLTEAATHATGPLHALSMYFDEPAFSEKKYQDLLLDKINCRSGQLRLTRDSFEELLPMAIDAMDLPSCDGINTWVISRFARNQGLKAVISGLGSDELFGGYPSFKRIIPANLLSLIPASLRWSLRNSNNKKLNRISYLNLKGAKGTYLFLRGNFTVNHIARHLDANESEVFEWIDKLPVMNDLDMENGNTASWLEFNIYMQNQLLRDADVMGMANSVEIRLPFLDFPLIEKAFSINSDVKFSDSRPKSLLLEAYAGQLPRDIWDRTKMGFALPFSEWVRHYDFFPSYLGSRAGKYFSGFTLGKISWNQILSLVMLGKYGKA